MSFLCEGYAQKFINLETYNIDSLLLILPGQQAEEKVNTLNNLAVSLSFIDFERSKQYADEAMNLSTELNYEEGKAAAFRNYGHIYAYQGNYPQALSGYFEALSRYEKLDKKHTAGCICRDIALTHIYARNYEKTIEFGHMALDKFWERTGGGTMVGSVRDTISIYQGFAITYLYMGMIEKSNDLFFKIIDVGTKNNFGMTELMIQTFRLGANYLLIGETDSAKVYFDKALLYPDANQDIQALKYRPVTGLGNLYSQIGKVDTAIVYLKKAYEWYNKNGYLYWTMYVSNDLGRIHYENSEIDIAKNYFMQSERIFNEMITKNSFYRYDSLKYVVNFGLELFFPFPHRQLNEMMWTQAKSMYYNLYQISEAKENALEALKYYIAYFNAVDTLNKLQHNREIIEIHTRYETERKEEQIESLSQENAFQEFKLKQSRLFLFGLGGLVVLIVILAIVLIRQNKLREQQKNLLLQQKLFRSQMNPHFIFNSLSSIQGFITEKDPRTASRYLSRFAKLIRNILDSSVEEFISLETEINTIENYLELQKVRYKGKFDYSIEVDEKIDKETISIPPMLAQPFIENSIEHGFKHKKARGNLKIRFSLKNNLIVFEVEDDGIGREKAQEIVFKQNKDHISMATDITRERLMVLNKKLKQKIRLNIVDLKNEKNEPAGTMVIFDIPYRYV